MRERLRRPRTKTKTCAHCKRRRPRLKIEWHPGILAWQCSDFTSCDQAVDRKEKKRVAEINAFLRKTYSRKKRT